MTVKVFSFRRRRVLCAGAALGLLAASTVVPWDGVRPAAAQTRMLVPTIERDGDKVRLEARYFLEDHNARYRLGVGAAHPGFREIELALSLQGVADAGEPVEFIEDLGPTRVRAGRVVASGYVLDGRKQFWRQSVTLSVVLPREAMERMGVLYFFLAVSGGTDSQGDDIWRVEQAGTVDTTFL